MEQKEEISRENLKRIIYILVVIIIILLLLLIFKIGKIGIEEKTASSNVYTGGISVTENDFEIGKDTKLNIFNNTEFNNKKIIAPHSKGTYKFYIRNKSNQDMTYNITFTDEVKKFVNMKYKLKMDNIYIKGNEEEYVTINNLNVSNISVLKDSANIFTLEWYWEDNDELDTQIGISDERYYTINLDIEASQN